jgi:hypothetical protein
MASGGGSVTIELKRVERVRCWACRRRFTCCSMSSLGKKMRRDANHKRSRPILDMLLDSMNGFGIMIDLMIAEKPRGYGVRGLVDSLI